MRRMDTSMIQIGVIVPVYNVECYLQKCIDSILSQTFRDFELILVDDGSTDNSGKICDEYAERNEKIRVVHTAHQGVSAARNKGLKENRGEYIAFVDSDDWLDRQYLEILYSVIRKFEADLVISCGINVLEGRRIHGSCKCWNQVISESEIISKGEAYRRMFVCENNVSLVSWAKLYHRDLVQTLCYPVGEIYEDSGTIDQIIEKCEKIVVTSYAGYYYLRRKGSIIHGRMSAKHMAGVRNAKHLWDFIRTQYPDIEEAAKIHYFRNCFDLLNLAIVDPEYKWLCRKLRKEIVGEKRFFLSCKYVNLIEKMGVVCLIGGLSSYKLSWRFYLWASGKRSGTMI